MCPAPLSNDDIVNWLRLAKPTIAELGDVVLRRIDDLLYVEVDDPSAFEQLPVYAEVLADPLGPGRAASQHGCCCQEQPAETVDDAEAPTVLPTQYLNHTTRSRWIRLVIPPNNYSLAVAEIHTRLAGAQTRCMPVYRRGGVYLALQFDELVAHVPGLRRDAADPRRDEVLRLARGYDMKANFVGGSMVVLTAPRALGERDLVSFYRSKFLRAVRYQQVPMKGAIGLGSPVPRRTVRAETGRTVRGLHPLLIALPGSRPVGPAADVPIGLAGDGPYHLKAIGLTSEVVVGAPADPPVIVAIIDEDCNRDIYDLAPSLAASSSEHVEFGPLPNAPAFVAPARPVQSHGTACAGVIGAQPEPYPQTVGVTPSVKLLPIGVNGWRACHVVQAIERARKDPGVKVLSLSLAWYEDGLSSQDFMDIAQALYRAHYESGILIIAASGNVLEQTNLDRQLGFPACLPWVMPVGAVTRSGRHKEFDDDSGEMWASRHVDSPSPTGHGVGRLSVVAPGVQICTSDSVKDRYSTAFNGTSAATPQVAGLAALLFQKYTELKLGPDRVRAIIEATAVKEGAEDGFDWHAPNDVSTRSRTLGYGRINVARALDFADMRVDLTGAVKGEWQSKDPSTGVVKMTVQVRNDGPATARKVSVRVWVMPNREHPWVLTQELALAEDVAVSEGRSGITDTLDRDVAKIVDVELNLESADLTPEAYFLIAVDAENDYAFKATLPAIETENLRHNNLARVSLTTLLR